MKNKPVSYNHVKRVYPIGTWKDPYGRGFPGYWEHTNRGESIEKSAKEKMKKKG